MCFYGLLIDNPDSRPAETLWTYWNASVSSASVMLLETRAVSVAISFSILNSNGKIMATHFLTFLFVQWQIIKAGERSLKRTRQLSCQNEMLFYITDKLN